MFGRLMEKYVIMTNYCCFLRYGKHKIQPFFNFVFFAVIVMQLLFTCKCLLSVTGNAPLIFYFELIFCFEAPFKNSYLICSVFSYFNISTLITYLTIKDIYIFVRVSRITNSFKQIKHHK